MRTTGRKACARRRRCLRCLSLRAGEGTAGAIESFYERKLERRPHYIGMPKRTKSSARWLAEHASDEYVQRAQREGFRSRAVYKLAEIQASEQLLRRGMRVVDLGAAPGGWSQYAARVVGPAGLVVATDVLSMD